MDAVELLSAGELFRMIPRAELEAVARSSNVKHLDAGEILYRAGARHSAVVYLALGAMALYRRNPAEDITLLLGIVEAPSLFGDAECAAGSDWTCSVRAEEPAWCVLIPNEVFLALVDRNGALASRMYRDASVRHLLANQTAQALALYDVKTRLLRLLFDLGRRFGRREGDRLVVERALSKVELAGAIGVSRKTVTRTLLPLEKSGIIEFRERDVVISGIEALEREMPRTLFGLSSRTGEKVLPVSSRWTEGEDE